MGQYDDLTIKCTCMSHAMKKTIDNALESMHHGWSMNIKALVEAGHDMSTGQEQADGLQQVRQTIRDVPTCPPPTVAKELTTVFRKGVKEGKEMMQPLIPYE